ncbi:SPFH domain-containing protein [Acetobacter sp. DsW_063]|uniref:SPFH domain-containing protein n=1 Tax=Acetobacter sp. DsW_063 TaxID=1514894 RepID=UPI000A38B713|nr:SPFH domain-containing protein [Acetobacter sp. DsW_063]
MADFSTPHTADTTAAPPTAPSSAATRSLTRILALTGATSLIGALAAFVVRGAALRPAAAHTAFADLVLRSPLSGAVVASFVLTCGATFSALPLLRAIRSPDRKIPLWPQAVLLTPCLALSFASASRAFTHTAFVASGAIPAAGPLATGVLAFAFVLLLAERFLTTRPTAMLRPVSGAPGVLRLCLCVLLLAGLLLGDLAGGGTPPAWLWKVPAGLVVFGSCEIVLRLVAGLFAPPAEARTARSCVDVVAFSAPRALTPAHIGDILRRKFGLDFERSWALAFVRRAAPPVALAMLLLTWAGSGVVQIPQNQRGVYERFGVPTAVLRPGLHVTLPAPLGRVRLVEFGAIHSLAVSDATAAARASDVSTAEGEPPDSANRLWDGSPEDASYLVARTQSDGRAGFETMTANLRVLYRVRLSDHGAMDSLYTVASPETLLRSLARRRLVDFFASETLDGVMATRREHIAETLSRNLQQDLDSHRSGLEVVAVLVDSVQPPAAAAKAWRLVQAAEIKARTSISEENARAEETHALAARDSYTDEAQATAQAQSIRSSAEADAARMDGDATAWRVGGRAFLLERYLANLKRGLVGANITVLDAKVQNALLDMRAGATSPSAPQDNLDTK